MIDNSKISLQSLKDLIQNLTKKPIVYQNYYNNSEKITTGLRIEECVKRIHSKIGLKEIFNIAEYSPFMLDRHTPSWQVDLWEPFLDDNAHLTFDKMRNKKWIILKPRQIGFSYTLFRLEACLAMDLDTVRLIIATKDKTWVEQIIVPYAREVLPFMLLERGDKSYFMKERGISTKIFNYDPRLLTFMFPTLSSVQLLGIDTMKQKNRGKGGLSLVGIDEAAYVEEAGIIAEVLQPMVNSVDGAFLYGSTPNGDNWFKNSVERARQNPDKYMFNTYDLYTSGCYSEEKCDQIIIDAYNIHYDQDPTQTADQIAKRIAQEYFAFFDSSSTIKWLYPQFRQRPNVYTFGGRPFNFAPSEEDKRKNIDFDFPKWEVYTSIDYGGTQDPMAVLFAAVNTSGQVVIFDEIYESGIGIEETVKRMKDKCLMWGVTPRINWIDRSTESVSIQLNRNTALSIMTSFRDAGLYVTPVKKMQKADRLNIANEYFCVFESLIHPILTDKGSPKIFISDICTNLIKELLNLKINKFKKGNEGGQELKRVSFNLMKNDHACFTGDTLVSTVDGKKRIDELFIGDYVDTPTGYKKIEVVADTGNQQIISVKFSDNSILKCTADHPFYVWGKGLVPLSQITEDDILYKDSFKYKSTIRAMLHNMCVTGRSAKGNKTKEIKTELKMCTREGIMQFLSGLDRKQFSGVKIKYKRYTGLREKVYNLRVEDVGLFYAGNILVSNSDALLYLLSELSGYRVVRGGKDKMRPGERIHVEMPSVLRHNKIIAKAMVPKLRPRISRII